MPVSSLLLDCVVKAAVKHAANFFTFGIGGDLLVDVWDSWHRQTREGQRKAEVEAIAGSSPAEVQKLARSLAERESSLTPAQRQQLVGYLTQMPSAIRRTLRRPEDPQGMTVSPGLSFRGPE